MNAHQLQKMATLNEQYKEMRQERRNRNEWRKERHFEEPPPYGYFTDHLKPMIFLSLSTGIRKGTLFGLECGNVNFSERILVLRAEIEKTEEIVSPLLFSNTVLNVLVEKFDLYPVITPEQDLPEILGV